VSAIARAEPGGVVFHCGAGRDRAGQVSMLVLALAGVVPEDIAADYAASAERLTARYAARGDEDQGPALDAFLAERGTTASEVILAMLAELDVKACLCDAGLTERDIVRLRSRLLD
jgi:protein-tyrosine phosphatase